jgi:hypothetical protein
MCVCVCVCTETFGFGCPRFAQDQRRVSWDSEQRKNIRGWCATYIHLVKLCARPAYHPNGQQSVCEGSKRIRDCLLVMQMSGRQEHPRNPRDCLWCRPSILGVGVMCRQTRKGRGRYDVQEKEKKWKRGEVRVMFHDAPVIWLFSPHRPSKKKKEGIGSFGAVNQKIRQEKDAINAPSSETNRTGRVVCRFCDGTCDQTLFSFFVSWESQRWDMRRQAVC